MFISVFNGRVEGDQEAVVFLSGPWQIWGEGAFPGSVTHFLPKRSLASTVPTVLKGLSAGAGSFLTLPLMNSTPPSPDSQEGTIGM